MNKRLFRVLNFFAFNLLFFALYLNFIHKDKSALETLKTDHTNKVSLAVKNSSDEKKTLTIQSAKEVISSH